MTRSQKEILQDIVNRIREANLTRTEEFIPRSDSIYKKLLGDLVDSETEMFHFINLLREADSLFVIHIVEDDEAHDIKGVDGYVLAEASVVTRVREKSYELLEHIYESEMSQHKPANSIIHELIPRLSNYKNTPIGQALNAAIMLQQLGQVMEENYVDYTEAARERKLTALLDKKHTEELKESEMQESDEMEIVGLTDELSSREIHTGLSDAEPTLLSRRAVDTDTALELEQMDRSGQWGVAVDRFGVEFLVRIHFRKHEFHLVRNLVRQKKIAREKDLRMIRDMLRTMEDRIDENSELRHYRREIVELRRMVQMKLNKILVMKREMDMA